MSKEINLALGIQTRNFPVSFLRGLDKPEGPSPSVHRPITCMGWSELEKQITIVKFIKQLPDDTRDKCECYPCGAYNEFHPSRSLLLILNAFHTPPSPAPFLSTSLV